MLRKIRKIRIENEHLRNQLQKINELVSDFKIEQEVEQDVDFINYLIKVFVEIRSRTKIENIDKEVRMLTTSNLPVNFTETFYADDYNVRSIKEYVVKSAYTNDEIARTHNLDIALSYTDDVYVVEEEIKKEFLFYNLKETRDSALHLRTNSLEKAFDMLLHEIKRHSEILDITDPFVVEQKKLKGM